MLSYFPAIAVRHILINTWIYIYHPLQETCVDLKSEIKIFFKVVFYFQKVLRKENKVMEIFDCTVEDIKKKSCIPKIS